LPCPGVTACTAPKANAIDISTSGPSAEGLRGPELAGQAPLDLALQSEKSPSGIAQQLDADGGKVWQAVGHRGPRNVKAESRHAIMVAIGSSRP
jgi:hypothetical protein